MTLNTNFLVKLLIPILFAGSLFAEDEKISERIVGEWRAIKGTSNGEDPPPGYLEKLTFVFKDGKYRLNNSMPMDYTIDASKTPAWIDIKNSLKQVGIIKFVGNKLHICTGVHGKRPKVFSTKPGTNQTFLVLERK